MPHGDRFELGRHRSGLFHGHDVPYNLSFCHIERVHPDTYAGFQADDALLVLGAAGPEGAVARVTEQQSFNDAVSEGAHPWSQGIAS
jgi:hypothetical protein